MAEINFSFLDGENKQKKSNITNPNARKFYDTGIINLITPDDVDLVLNNIKGKYINQARACFIALYYTGARPVEILNLQTEDFKKQQSYFVIYFRETKKHGVPRAIYLKKNKHTTELENYVKVCIPGMYCFYAFKGKYKRIKKNKKGVEKEYIDQSAKLYNHVKKWTSVLPNGHVNQYFLRHSRMSQLAQAGATDRQLKYWKGSKTEDSIQPYIHMSEDTAKKLAKKVI